MAMIDDKEAFRGTTAVALDGHPIVEGEISGASVTTPTGRPLFEIGTPPDSQVDGIRDWRDQVLLRILTLSESLLNKGAGVNGDTPQRPAADASGWRRKKWRRT